MDKDELYTIFSRYLIGEADDGDIRRLRHWLKESKANRTLFYSITEYWDVERKYFLKDSDRLAKNVIQRIQKEEEQKTLQLSRKHKTRSMVPSKIAAAVTFFLIAGATLFFISRTDQAGFEQQLAMKYIEKGTKPGEKLNMRLPDGTHVKLNYNSNLIYPEKFSDSSRTVTLVGEAYFDVTKDSSRPFIVKSGEVSTTVLGTSFNIRAFPDEEAISVAVASGRVMVHKADNTDSLILHKKQMAVYSKKNKQTVKSHFDYSEIMGWKDGIIHFKNADIYEIFNTLEQWYGVKIVTNGKLNTNKGFTVSYEEKSLESILNGLAFTFNFNYTIDGDTVKITE